MIWHTPEIPEAFVVMPRKERLLLELRRNSLNLLEVLANLLLCSVPVIVLLMVAHKQVKAFIGMNLDQLASALKAIGSFFGMVAGTI